MDIEHAKTFIDKIKAECLRQIQSANRLSSARLLVKRLLSDPAHLIPEMLQNAEDAHATVLRIDLNRDRIIIQNNGEKFNDEQIEKLCSIGLSTKKTLGYIGMYGIGFKSVFAVCKAPEIYTGNYSFCFDEENVFVPNWIPPREEFSDWSTTVFLPLKDEQAYHALYKLISHLEEDNAKPMIFLKNIKEIRIRKDNTENVFVKDKISFPELTAIGDQFNFIEIKKNGSRATAFCVYTLKENIPSDLLKHIIQERQLFEIDEKKTYETQLNISFEIADNGHINPLQKGLLYAFLPTKVKTFLNFDINADFLLNPNREALNRIDDKYNCWLIAFAVKGIQNMIRAYKENTPKEFWVDIYDILPKEETARESWIKEEICQPIIEFIKDGEFFLTAHSERPWVSRSEIIEAPLEIRRLFPEFSEIDLDSEERKHHYLSESIRRDLRKFLVKVFDLKKIDIYYLLEVFSKLDVIAGKNDDWLFLLFVYLGERYLGLYGYQRDEFLEKSKNCYLIPCSNGITAKLTESRVYQTLKSLPEFLTDKALELRRGLYTKLKEDLKDNEDLQQKQEFAKEFLFALVKEATPKIIYDEILKYEFMTIGEGEIEEEKCKLLDKYVVFLKANNVKAEGIKLRVKGERVYKSSENLYLANDYLMNENGEILYNLEELLGECQDALFITPDYLNLDESLDADKTKKWTKFLLSLGVKDMPILHKDKILFSAKSKEDFINKFKEQIGPVTFQLKGTGRPYTGRYHYDMKNNAYKLKDYFFQESFASALDKKLKLKDINFFMEFLKMLDLHWENIKSWIKLSYLYTYVSRYGATQKVGEDVTPDFSSLGRWLQEKEWLPAKSWPSEEVKLTNPHEAYLLSVDTAGLKNAFYVEPDLIKNLDLRRFLKLRTAKIEIEPTSKEDLASLLELYKGWQKEGLPLSKEDEKSLGKLYRLLNEKMKVEAKDGSDDTWMKFKNSAKIVYDSSGNWNNIGNVHYYTFDTMILEKINKEMKREVLFIPYNITPTNIKFLLGKLGLRDLFLESSRVLPDEIAFETVENDYFIDLANALFSFLGKVKQEAELKEECEKIVKISCNHASYLTYALKRDDKIVSEWIRTDGILINGKFWFTGELRDLGVEVARELCIEFSLDKETQDFIEKVFARSENYIKRVLGASSKEYKILFEKTRMPKPKTEEQPIVIEKPPKVSIGEGRTTRGKEREKLYIKKIREIEEKAGQRTKDVSSENRGYDIESIGIEGEKYIEVKGITEVKLTDNEYKTASQLREKYWLYVVIKYNPFACRCIQNPAETCKFEKVYVDFRWSVQDWDNHGKILNG